MDFYTLKQKEINNLLNLKGSCLGLNNLTSSVLDYKDEFRILEWTTKDKVKRLNVFTSSNNQEKLLKFAVLLSAFEDRAVEFKIQEENVVEFIVSSKVKDIHSLKENSKYYKEIQDTFFPLGVIEDKTIKDGLIFTDENDDEFSVVGIDFFGDQLHHSFTNRNKKTSCILIGQHVLIKGQQQHTKVVLDNIVSTALDRANSWKLYGIGDETDSKYHLEFSNKDEIVKETLRKVKKELKDRYTLLESLSRNNLSDLPQEFYEASDFRNILLVVNNVNKVLEDQENREILQDIIRLGRSAKISTVLITEEKGNIMRNLHTSYSSITQFINCLDEDTFSFSVLENPYITVKNFK